MTTAKELQAILEEITANTPDGMAFLEKSRERERAYAMSSVNRWLEIVQILEKAGPIKRCLDVGTSPLTFALPRWCQNVETLDVTGYFESRCQAAGVKLHVGGLNWKDGVLPEGYYDCIIFLEVIEHLRMNPEKVIGYLKQKLKPGGLLILSTPNLMCFGNRLKMLFNMKLAHFHYPAFGKAEDDVHGFGHDRVYTPAEMKDYFVNTSWSSFELGYHGIPVSDSLKSYSMGKKLVYAPVQLVKRLVPSTRQLMLVVAKK
jgi:hypothetical protein